MRNTLCEQMFSASPPNSDIPRCGWHFAFVPTAEVSALIRSPRRRWRGAFLRGRAVLGGVGAFGGGYGLARISAFTYRPRLPDSWAHSRRPSGPTYRGSRTR